jgi:CRP-like cAMP-binding protein
MLTSGAFGDRARSLLAGESNASTVRVARRRNVYTGGSRDEMLYFIAVGLVKVIRMSPAGKECLLAIYSDGDFFGESCLSGEPRFETAITMRDSVLNQIKASRFLALISQAGLGEDFVRQLAVRLTEQQHIITNLSRKLGARNARGLGQKISHQELSEMVGTTRPRISEFMQRFRGWGLIDMTPDSHICIREGHIRQYLEKRDWQA